MAAPEDAWWFYNVTPAQIDVFLTGNNGRIVSLQGEQAPPITFTVAMIKNTNLFAKTWWWFHDLTRAQAGGEAR